MLFDKISKTLEEFGKSKVQKNPKLEKYLSNLNDQYYKYKYSPKFQTKYKGNYNEGKLLKKLQCRIFFKITNLFQSFIMSKSCLIHQCLRGSQKTELQSLLICYQLLEELLAF